MILRVSLTLGAALGMVAPAFAQTSFPMVTHAHPVAVQRGKTTLVTVEGVPATTNFAGAYKALFEGTGLSAEVEPPPASSTPARVVKLKVTAAPQALPGVREFRVATSLSLSSLGQLVITDEPVVVEAAKNNTPAEAQAVQLPCVLAGKLEAVEDVDYVKFEARQGEVLTFELYCARLQDKIHDLQKHAKPMLTLYDAAGRELAANDHFYFADPLLSYQVSKTGTYYLQVRDSTYDGDPRWVYALVMTNRPYASHVYPMAGQVGSSVEVEPIGSARHARAKVAVQVPAVPGIHLVQLDDAGGKTNPVTFYASKLPQTLEHEPNDEVATATRVTLPCGINGRIDRNRDLDHFVFAASKGKAIRFELKARRFGTLLNSQLHGILEVLTEKGAVIAGNDTTHGQEAALVFTPPRDGQFVLRVRDLNSKGSDAAVYHVEADWATPDFTLRCDPDKAMLGPGASAAWYVQLTRTNGFTGPVRVEVHGLPRDVTASPLTIAPAMTQGALVLTAGPGATHDAVNVTIVGTAETLTRTANPLQEIYFPGGGRGRFETTLQSVALTAPGDILKVDVSPTRISLKPGAEVKIDVAIQRRPDFDKGVSLDVLLQHLGALHGNPLPPGVTVVPGKSKTLLGTGSKGHVVLKADPNSAPIEDVPICVLANVSINFVVKQAYASPPIVLTVRK